MCSLSETFFYIAVLIEIIVDWYALVRNNRGISCSPYLVSLNGNVLQNSSINSVQFSSPVVSNSLGTAAGQASLSITNSRSSPKPMSIESVMPSNHLTLCCPLLLLPSIFPSIRVFSNESVGLRWPKYWSFSFSISLSNECSGLISFMTDWFDLLPVHGTLKSLLQHYSSKASVLWHLAFFMVTSHNSTWLLEKP